MQGAQQFEGIDVAIHRTVAGPENARPNLRQARFQRRVVQHFERIVAGQSGAYRLQAGTPLHEQLFGVAKTETARLAEPYVDTSQLEQLPVQHRPQLRRVAGPTCVG